LERGAEKTAGGAGSVLGGFQGGLPQPVAGNHHPDPSRRISSSILATSFGFCQEEHNRKYDGN